MASVDTGKILNDARAKLEKRFLEVQELIKPLRDEESEVAEAIKRLTGEWPKGYPPAGSAADASKSSKTRRSITKEEVFDFIKKNPGTNNPKIKHGLGASAPQVAKIVTDNLIKNGGPIRPDGIGAGRKLYIDE